MALWGNNDAANSKPLLPQDREVREVTLLTTNVAITTGNTLTFTTAVPSSITVGQYVYSLDSNNAVSRCPDGSITDQNDVSFIRSNNTVKTIDASNNTVRLTNNIMATLANGSIVYFANTIPYSSGETLSTYFADTILITATRSSNNRTSSPSPATANVGNLNQGWNHVVKKTNADGSIRYLVETLVALANTTASNTASGNASFGIFVSGV